MNNYTFLFKASWRATALSFHVLAPNEDVAQRKAEGKVLRMEGGVHCLEVKLVRRLD